MTKLYENYVDGRWVSGSDRIDVENPATGEVFAQAALASASDVDAAVAAARACVDGRRLTDIKPSERGRMLMDMAQWIRDHQDEIVALLTQDSGKTLQESEWEVAGSAGFIEFYGGMADKIAGSYIPMGGGFTDYVVPVPYGVSAHIIPWNYPFEITARGFGPAFAAGNAVVVKSPELDPTTVTYFGRAAEAAGVPRGALNIVCGLGHVAGDALSKHTGINQITFTGSVATGQKILGAAAQSVIPAVVELGGKSPGIVLPDADLDHVADQVRWAIFSNSGQVCSALSRLLVPSNMHDEVVDRVVAIAEALVVGNGATGADMGPLISETQRGRVTEHVRKAQEDGVDVVTGGNPRNQPGFFFDPTVIVGATNDMEIAQEEVFGPVLTVLPYNDVDHALEMANDSQYGLVAGVFGNDLGQVTHLADRLEAGQIFVNEWFKPGIEAPFGGFKKSGFGREKGQAAVGSYYQLKNVGISQVRA